MSTEYLSNFSDINDIFQDCLEMSSQIANLPDWERDFSRHEVRDLPHIASGSDASFSTDRDHFEAVGVRCAGAAP